MWTSVSEFERNSLQNIRWGVGWGLRLAGLFALLAILAVPIRVFSEGGGILDASQLLALTLVIYLLSGIVGGGIVGFLRPFTGRWVGAVLVGFLAGVPIALGVLLAVGGLDVFGLPVILASAGMALLWSMVAVSVIWHGHSPD